MRTTATKRFRETPRKRKTIVEAAEWSRGVGEATGGGGEKEVVELGKGAVLVVEEHGDGTPLLPLE